MPRNAVRIHRAFCVGCESAVYLRQPIDRDGWFTRGSQEHTTRPSQSSSACRRVGLQTTDANMAVPAFSVGDIGSGTSNHAAHQACGLGPRRAVEGVQGADRGGKDERRPSRVGVRQAAGPHHRCIGKPATDRMHASSRLACPVRRRDLQDPAGLEAYDGVHRRVRYRRSALGALASVRGGPVLRGGVVPLERQAAISPGLTVRTAAIVAADARLVPRLARSPRREVSPRRRSGLRSPANRGR